MSFARRTDATHKPISDALKACGWQVEQAFRMRGGWDLIAWKHGDPASIRLIECKSKGGKPTPAQQKLAERGCPTVTITSPEQAAQLR